MQFAQEKMKIEQKKIDQIWKGFWEDVSRTVGDISGQV
jgi:hypothetical protein